MDNHAHVMAAAGADGRAGEEFDTIACGGLEFVSLPPVRLRTDNPIYTTETQRHGLKRYLFKPCLCS